MAAVELSLRAENGVFVATYEGVPDLDDLEDALCAALPGERCVVPQMAASWDAATGDWLPQEDAEWWLRGSKR